MQSINQHLNTSLEALKGSQSDFPTPEHELAWDIATRFKEPYGTWVRLIKISPLNTWTIRREFEAISNKGFHRKDKIRMFMKTIFTRK